MKRISLLVLVALAASPEFSWARHYVPYTTGIRYSPYAFGLKSSGLIPGSVHFNSYAFGTEHHGLTSDRVRFSPYAFSTKHSGLISTVGCDFVPCTPWFSDSRSEARELSRAINTLSESVKPNNRSPYTTRTALRMRTAPRRRVSRRRRSYSSNDQTSMIGEHLMKVIPGQYKITHLLRTNKDTISFDIVLKEKNLVIKYWNQAKIESMNEKAEPKEKQVYTDYINTWAEFANRVELAGGTVVHLACKDQDQILGELATHLEVNND
jgi:hypothetical protein